MKKTIMTLLAALLMLPAFTQTNFRSITLDEAVTIAKAENKMVFIDFYTDWCGPCKMMMNNVFPLKEVGDYFNNKYICIKLNAEKGGKEAAQFYKVKAYPTFIVLDADKKVLMQKEGGSSDGQQFINSIEQQVNPEKSPERLKQRYEAGERTANLISAYAGLKMEEARQSRRPDQTRIDEAYKIVDDYFTFLTDADRLKEENYFMYSNFLKDVQDAKTRFLVAHRAEFPATLANKVTETLDMQYQLAVRSYLTGGTPYDATVFNALKKEISEQGMNKYDGLYRLIECYAKGDMSAYLEQCKKEYDALPADQQEWLMTNFSRILPADNAEIRQAGAKFIRSKLENMNINTMFFTLQELMQLERTGH